jgi:GTP-binding protein
MLIDETTIFVRAGKGGDGCVSFRREKYIPKGGPDGGDGGDGGSVILVGDSSTATLLGLAQRPHLRAEKGGAGMGKNMAGAAGADLLVPVPLGTLVYDRESGALLADISTPGQRFIAAQGGKGGLGNDRFKSPTNQTPRHATPGEEGEELTLRLELKLIADVGLIGLPNAGKSTLLRAVTRATPKVADYPFTTLSPNLGLALLPGVGKGDERRLVLADIPGLIEGAAEGAGLGHDFLRHIERTSVLVHVLEVQPADGSDPAANHRAIRAELGGYSPALLEKPEVLALNKIDLVPEGGRDSLVKAIVQKLKRARGSRPPIVISGATGEGTRDLLEACWSALDRAAPPAWATAERADRSTT